MLQKIMVQCKYEGEERANYNWGSLFHGFLIKSLPPEISEMLHRSQLRPFSQYVLSRHGGQLTWVIGLLESEIANHIVQAIMPLTQIELQQKAMTLAVTAIQRNSQSVQDYFKKFFTADKPCRRYGIEFLTPSTHKQDGVYTLFPSPELMINNINKRYCAYMQNVSLDDPEAMEQIVRHTRIVRYSLHTAVYYLENTKITGYMGRITLVLSGPEQLARVAGALLSFAEYSGLGIKTALGMGGVRIKEII